MLWMYTVEESGELLARDADSREDIQKLDGETDWFWVDSMDPADKEYEVISGLLGEKEIVDEIRKQKIFARPERVNGYLLFSIPQALFKNGLKTFPIYVLIKDSMLLTIRSSYSSKSIKNTLKTFEDCVGKICDGEVNSTFILSRLFHETSNENLDAVMMLRESARKIERTAFENPSEKKISRSVFAAKREISAFERILWSQRELMLRISEGVIPTLKTSEEINASLSHPIDNVSRELSLLDSLNNALDSVLNLQNLGMIHRVEKGLIRFALIAFVISIVIILLKIDIIKLLSQ